MSNIKKLRYCQTEGENPFNWHEALMGTDQDDFEAWYRLSQKSDSWTTCAVGNMCSILPRREGGSPIDDELYRLGHNFHEAVKERDAATAMSILNQIEKRSKRLILDIIKGKKS